MKANPPISVPVRALEAFSALIPRGGQILCLDDKAAAWFAPRGLEIHALAPDKDLRFLSLKRESYDGVWAGSALLPLSIEDAQRVIAAFFQALTPLKGAFFAAHSYPEAAFASLMRQNGFQILTQAQSEGVACVVSRRI